MKTTKILIILLGILLLGAIFIYCPKPKPEVIIKTDTVYSEKTITDLTPDTTIKDLSNDLLKALKKIKHVEAGNKKLEDSIIKLKDLKPIIDTVYVIVDDWLATRFYLDTLFNDSTGLLILSDSISKNRIKSRSYQRLNIITEKTILQDNLLFIGGGINTYSDIHVGASYMKNKNLFSINAGYRLMPDNERKPFVEIDYKRNINFKPIYGRH
jgi:hypothetical protein